VIQYHRRQGIRLPDKTVHALIHVIVENQVALGDKYPVKSVLSRLIAEGLNRHEAVHAIGSVRMVGYTSPTSSERYLPVTPSSRRNLVECIRDAVRVRFWGYLGGISSSICDLRRSVSVLERLHCSDNFQFIRPTNQDLCSPSGVFLMVMGGS
jgi:hypothetical protein